jgi:hypothetical protein
MPQTSWTHNVDTFGGYATYAEWLVHEPEREALYQARRQEAAQLEAAREQARAERQSQIEARRVEAWQRREKAIKARAARAKGTDYSKLARDMERSSKARAKRERNAQKWAEQQTIAHNFKLLTLADRIERRMRAPGMSRSHALAQFALWASDDHDYIEAMFNLYTQGRARLL